VTLAFGPVQYPVSTDMVRYCMQLGLPAAAAAAAAAAGAYRVAWRDTSPLKFVAVLSRFIS